MALRARSLGSNPSSPNLRGSCSMLEAEEKELLAKAGG